jgi:hypothetical protein
MRKALDMDYELGRGIEQKRQKEIEEVFERRQCMEKEEVIEGRMAVSIDATKVREKQGEYVDSSGRKRYEIGFVNIRRSHNGLRCLAEHDFEIFL